METTQTKVPTGLHTLYALEPCTPETLILICRLLLLRGFSGRSAVYILPDGAHLREGDARFCIALAESAPAQGTALPSATALLEEYGTRIASSSMLLCLSEHAVCLCAENAVARIAALYPSTSSA